MELEEKRMVPTSWRDYLAEFGETKRVFQWARREFDTPASRHWTHRLVVGLLIYTVLQAAQPWIVAAIFNGLIARSASVMALTFSIFVVCLLFQKMAIYHQAAAREWLLGLNWGRLDERITELFFAKSLQQHVQEGAALSVANIDKGRWRLLELQGMLLFEGIPALLELTISFLFLWILSPVAGGLLTVMLVGTLLWMLFLNVRVMQVCTPLDAEFRRLNRHRVERWENIERVKTSAKGSEELRFLSTWFEDVISKDRRFWLWFARQSTARELVGSIPLLAIMAYGAWLVWSSRWEIGFLYPLYSWSTQVVESIWRVQHVEHMLNWNIPSVKSMIDALSIPSAVTEQPGAVVISKEKPVEIRFEKVSFTYQSSAEEGGEKIPPHPVLRNLSLVIRPGQKVALISPSGGGKTTLMKLLLRYMDPDNGRILINGVDLREVELSSWMRYVGYIPQQPQILDGTIRYNLKYAVEPEKAEALGDGVVWRAMNLLQINFNGRLTSGLNTVVGQRGMRLSGGQAQRVMIGAAAMKAPKFMVIDEATSNLDSTTERLVHDGLKSVLTPDVGALVVAHRLSTVRDLCDQFVVLRPTSELQVGDSQIEAVASSFEDLYVISPTFRRLADDQGISVSE